jgi:hypothetical protein
MIKNLPKDQMNLFHADLERMKGSTLFVDDEMKDAASCESSSLLQQSENNFIALLLQGPFITQSFRLV